MIEYLILLCCFACMLLHFWYCSQSDTSCTFCVRSQEKPQVHKNLCIKFLATTLGYSFSTQEFSGESGADSVFYPLPIFQQYFIALRHLSEGEA